jgi:uncharacterized membrane protein YdjX (TVP38/TMEM64 family)
MLNPQKEGRIHWVRLLLILVGFILLSVTLGYLLQMLLSKFHIPQDASPWLVYSIIFGVTLVVNLSVVPLPFAISLMIAASMRWNPVLVALSGSLGASLGEFSSYMLGYFGTRVAIHQEVVGYKLVQRWIHRWGIWAIALLSFQPILPFEIGGFIAGLTKMPIHKFLPALWAGKFPKYLILVYGGKELIHLIPFLHQ